MGRAWSNYPRCIILNKLAHPHHACLTPPHPGAATACERKCSRVPGETFCAHTGPKDCTMVSIPSCMKGHHTHTTFHLHLTLHPPISQLCHHWHPHTTPSNPHPPCPPGDMVLSTYGANGLLTFFPLNLQLPLHPLPFWTISIPIRCAYWTAQTHDLATTNQV